MGSVAALLAIVVGLYLVKEATNGVAQGAVGGTVGRQNRADSGQVLG